MGTGGRHYAADPGMAQRVRREIFCERIIVGEGRFPPFQLSRTFPFLMSPEPPTTEPAAAPPAKEPRQAPAIAHSLRQILRRSGGSPNGADWPALAAEIGAPEAQIRSVAGFFEEFSQSPRQPDEISPPFGPAVRRLVPEGRLSGPDNPEDAFALVAALRSAPEPAETIRKRLAEVERLDSHRAKHGRSLLARWSEAAATAAPQRFVVCHADAGNPGAHGGDWLLEHRPGSVLAGMALAATLIGADEGVICVDRSRTEAIAILRQAIEQANDSGRLGKTFDVSVLPTFGSHVGGEETALLNAIEGLRGEARPRPPEPEAAGIFGLPTVIETAEIFALLPDWLRRGRDDGSRLVALMPPFAQPGLVEIDAGVTLGRILDFGGWAGDPPAALLIGGPFGGFAFPADWDLPLGADALASRGIFPGNWSLEPVPVGTAFREWANRRLGFAATESCGRCVPCRLGPMAGLEALGGAEVNFHRLREILETVAMTSLCGFGRDFPRALMQWLDRWGLNPAAPPALPAVTESE
jgi:NADH:ubiquinone oxidoreductase subunit F (NADH-binding)